MGAQRKRATHWHHPLEFGVDRLVDQRLDGGTGANRVGHGDIGFLLDSLLLLDLLLYAGKLGLDAGSVRVGSLLGHRRRI